MARRRGRRRQASRSRSTRDASPPSAPASRTPTDAGRTTRRTDAARFRQRAQPRLPSGAAGPHPRRRSRLVLDVARSDVRRRRSAHPRQLPPPRPRRVRRDGDGGHHRRRRVPLRPSPGGTVRRTTTRTRWPRRSSPPPTRPASGSRCSTPATSMADSAVPVRFRSTGSQLRFGDGTVERWAERAGELGNGERVRIGAAVHSVRAVSPAAIDLIADWAEGRGAPLHAHVSEQPAENEACLAAHGRTPVEVFESALGPRFTAVHATHLTPSDLTRLGASASTCCLCPTTERDLADGVARAADLARRGRATGGRYRLPRDDRHVRGSPGGGVERTPRVGERGRHTPAELAAMATGGRSRRTRDGPTAAGSRSAPPPT